MINIINKLFKSMIIVILLIITNGCNSTVKATMPIAYEQYTSVRLIQCRYENGHNLQNAPQVVITFSESTANTYLNSQDVQKQEYKRMCVVCSETERLGIELPEGTKGSFAAQYLGGSNAGTEEDNAITQTANSFHMSRDAYINQYYDTVCCLGFQYDQYFSYYAKNIAHLNILNSSELNALVKEIGADKAYQRYYTAYLPALQSYNTYLDELAKKIG